MNKKVIIAIVATFVGTSFMWIVVLVALFFFGSAEPPFLVSFDHPPRAALGETIALHVTVTNAADESVTLGSIDVYDSLLGGFELAGSDPPYVNAQHIFTFNTLWYDHPMSARETVSITIFLLATRAGRHHGQVEICTATERCTAAYVAIEVGDEASAG